MNKQPTKEDLEALLKNMSTLTQKSLAEMAKMSAADIEAMQDLIDEAFGK